MDQNKIISFNDARDAAKKMNQDTLNKQKEKQSAFETILNRIEKINPSLGGMEEMSMLLSLPEEHFAILAPVFLDELEKSYNNVQDKIFIAQAVNAAGQKI